VIVTTLPVKTPCEIPKSIRRAGSLWMPLRSFTAGIPIESEVTQPLGRMRRLPAARKMTLPPVFSSATPPMRTISRQLIGIRFFKGCLSARRSCWD